MDAKNSVLNLSVEQLRRAAELKEQIESLNDELSQLLSGQSAKPGRPPGGGRRKMSAEAKARIAAAARARWARYRADKGEGAAPAKAAGGKKKRKMSAEAKKRISEAAKARWERFRAEKSAA